MRDVAIIGGGPGGLYAAYKLARCGWNVVVFEEHASAGEPVHCTGVLAVEAFDEFQVPRDAILNSLRTAEFVGPSGVSIEYSTRNAEAVVIDRRAFDDELCRQAKAAGATVQVGTKITDLHASEQSVKIERGTETPIEARACILACGANYTLQRRLGLGMPALHLQSAQLEVPAASPRHVEIHFGAVAPKGFAWVVPVHRPNGTFARVGLMCDRDAREHFDRFLERVGPRWRTGNEASLSAGMSPRTKLLPLAPIARTYAMRLLAVGDAAGLVKATTGGGIYYSLLSGSLAADVLSEALERNELTAPALWAYEQRWRSLLGEELAAQRTLRRIADDLSNDEIEGLFQLAQTDGVMPIVRRTATFNRHRQLILSLLAHPPARKILMRRMLGWAAPA